MSALSSDNLKRAAFLLGLPCWGTKEQINERITRALAGEDGGAKQATASALSSDNLKRAAFLLRLPCWGTKEQINGRITRALAGEDGGAKQATASANKWGDAEDWEQIIPASEAETSHASGLKVKSDKKHSSSTKTPFRTKTRAPSTDNKGIVLSNIRKHASKATLQSFCRDLGLKKSGNISELINRVTSDLLEVSDCDSDSGSYSDSADYSDSD